MHKSREIRSLMVLATVMLLVSLGSVYGQDGGDREGRGDRGDRGNRRGDRDIQNMSEEQREQMRERFAERAERMRAEQAERMQEDLELSTEEYTALEPMIEKVQRLTRESLTAGRNPAGRGGRGDRGGFRNPFDDDADRSPQAQALTDASAALSEVLDQDEPSADQIKQRLTALREARIAMQDALRQAREELRGFLTPEQEAQLVLRGLLD